MSLCQIGSLTLWHVAAETLGGTPFYVAAPTARCGQGRFFLGIGILLDDFFFHFCSFSLKPVPKIQEHVFLEQERAPARQTGGIVSELVFTKNRQI